MTNKFVALIIVVIITLFSFVSSTLAATHAATVVTNQEVFKYEMLTAARSHIVNINKVDKGTHVTLVLRDGVTQEVEMPKGWSLELLVRRALQAQTAAQSASERSILAIPAVPVVIENQVTGQAAEAAHPAANPPEVVDAPSAESLAAAVRVAEVAGFANYTEKVRAGLFVGVAIGRHLEPYGIALSTSVGNFWSRQKAIANKGVIQEISAVINRLDTWVTQLSLGRFMIAEGVLVILVGSISAWVLTAPKLKKSRPPPRMRIEYAMSRIRDRLRGVEKPSLELIIDSGQSEQKISYRHRWSFFGIGPLPSQG